MFLPKPINADGRWLFVRMGADRKMSLNDRLFTSREDFKRELSEAVCPRAERLVFFEADPSLPYSEVVQEMAAINALCDVTISLITTQYDRKYLFGVR